LSFDVVASIGGPAGGHEPFVGLLEERMLNARHGQELRRILDELGKRSAIAQKLPRPITCSSMLVPGQNIYLLAHGRRALGFLKVGHKRLFVSAPPQLQSTRGSSVQEALRSIEPLCALDFYVHESCQRSGFGKLIFDTMLKHEGAVPVKMAYDRPSPKLLGFLEKYYGLSRYTPQNNNFVVYHDYFKADTVKLSRGTRGKGEGCGIMPGVKQHLEVPCEAIVSAQDERCQPQGTHARPPQMPGTVGIIQDGTLRGTSRGASPFNEQHVVMKQLGSNSVPSRALQTPWGTSSSRQFETSCGCPSTANSNSSLQAAGRPSGACKSRSSSLPAGHGDARRASSTGAAGNCRGRTASPLSQLGRQLVRS